MPTVLRVGGLRIAIYPNDHRPAHVHAFGPSQEAVFILNCPDGPLRLRGSLGFSVRALNRLEVELQRGTRRTLRGWSRLHGHH